MSDLSKIHKLHEASHGASHEVSTVFIPIKGDRMENRQVAALEHIAKRMSDNTEHLADMKGQMAEYLAGMNDRIAAMEKRLARPKRTGPSMVRTVQS